MKRVSNPEFLLPAICLGLSASAAVPARAQCDQWDISGDAVQVKQSAGGFAVFDLALDGENVRGTARTGRAEESTTYALGLLTRGGDYTEARGSVDGVYSNGRLEMQVRWYDGKIGIYDIRIDARGRLSGRTYDFNRPSSRADIIGTQRLSCADVTTASEPPHPPIAPEGEASSVSLRSGTVRKLGKRPIAPAPTPVARRFDKRLPVSRTGTTTVGAVACKAGYVMRQAGPSDSVCVAPASRSRAASENAGAPSRWITGPYGPRTCRPGFVWREAFRGDTVCVIPSVRAYVSMENRLAASRREQ